MKKRLWIVPLLLVAAAALGTRAADPLEVTVEDLAAAGVAEAVAVPTEANRYLPPVRYFRTKEKLSASDAKKDCSDCADLVAVHVADVAAVPSWVATPQLQFMRFGARLQLRSYIPETKRVVIVTGPNEAMIRKISNHLLSKFSR
ncbi:MAG: hypothetical protein QY323_00230 [Patescibacteria group bacterium]|nr:MAG: hypothetical protein QY323_00230 [Patescibacteria group bacterium]